MGFGSVWHWIVVLIIVLVLFGRGRISEVMGDFGKGIKSFKQGMNEGEEVKPQPPAGQIAAPAADQSASAEPVAEKTDKPA
ncbi:MAG: twin-arginine translocase TatA/TatE family subunit [Sphingomonadaceae bacterium]|nr:twin-arginine translocase TatA/TatE family subunit [Sphingomonadaceae bacterium]